MVPDVGKFKGEKQLLGVASGEKGQEQELMHAGAIQDIHQLFPQ